jgi:hypothetical protein
MIFRLIEARRNEIQSQLPLFGAQMPTTQRIAGPRHNRSASFTSS